MNVLIYAAGQDTAGQGFRIKSGFDRLMPGWSVNSWHQTQTYMRYPADSVQGGGRRLRDRYREADVVHLRNRLHGWERFDAGQRKPVILHHHGTVYRTTHASLHPYAASLGAVQLVSTIDLEILQPGVTWLPAPYDLRPLRALREAYRPSDVIRIAHAPTDRLVKSTAAVIAAVAELQARGIPVELDLIERRPWAECLQRKAQADIFVDQLGLGYGCNAVEAWGMGMPVVANAADPAVLARMRELFDGPLPFYQATEDTLADRLAAMVKSPSLRQEYAAIGTAHVERFHDELVVIPKLADIYRSAPPTVDGRAYRQLRREERVNARAQLRAARAAA